MTNNPKSKIQNLPLVVIVGPTASGKSALALKVAQQCNGEIICADSRTVYAGMDIATAKPSAEDRRLVPHWGLDLVQPGERFSAADFKQYADKKITEIRKRGHVPLLVGGTGLYVDAVLFGYTFGTQADEKLRSELQRMSLDELYEYCATHSINLPENDKNKRYIIRSIENGHVPQTQNTIPVYENIIVGITTEKNVLRERIVRRIEQQLANGVVEEAIMLGKKYSWNSESMKSNMYPIIHDYVENRITIDEFKSRAIVADWRLAKRQLTWLRRHPIIHWDTPESLNTYIVDQLASTM